MTEKTDKMVEMEAEDFVSSSLIERLAPYSLRPSIDRGAVIETLTVLRAELDRFQRESAEASQAVTIEQLTAVIDRAIAATG